MSTLHDQAVRFTVGVLRRTSDWQDGQHALANETRFAPLFGDDDLATAQSIIREAEEILGDALPY